MCTRFLYPCCTFSCAFSVNAHTQHYSISAAGPDCRLRHLQHGISLPLNRTLSSHHEGLLTKCSASVTVIKTLFRTITGTWWSSNEEHT